jgi:hypothetical protein
MSEMSEKMGDKMVEKIGGETEGREESCEGERRRPFLE